MASSVKEAARQLTEEIGEWEADVEAATTRFGQLTSDLAALEKSLDQAIADLEREVADFVAKVGAETAGLAREIDDAHQSLTRAEKAAERAQASAAAAIAAGEQEAEGLAERLGGRPDQLEQVVAQSIETPASQLGQQARALGTVLEQALDGTTANVTSFGAVAATMEDAIPAAADGMGAAIKLADKLIGEAFVEWTSHLFEMVDKVDNEGFEPMTANAGEVASHALGECRAALDRAAGRAFQRVEQLEGELDAIGEDIKAAAGEQVADGLSEPVESALEDLQAALQESTTWLKEVQSWLSDYRFMNG